MRIIVPLRWKLSAEQIYKATEWKAAQEPCILKRICTITKIFQYTNRRKGRNKAINGKRERKKEIMKSRRLS